MNSKAAIKTYRYAILDKGMTFKDAYYFNSNWDEDHIENLVLEAVKYYYHTSGGWRERWPLSFEVFKSDGLSLGVFNVKKEPEPRFYIYPKNKSIDSTNQAGSSHG